MLLIGTMAWVYMDLCYLGLVAWDRVICPKSLEHLVEKIQSRRETVTFRTYAWNYSFNIIDLYIRLFGLGMVSEPNCFTGCSYFPKIIGIRLNKYEKRKY